MKFFFEKTNIFFNKRKKKRTFANVFKPEIMQAFIPSAGLGTRLKPLTDNRPKALVEVQGRPLLEIALHNLIRQGVSRIVVNVHHYADMICEYVANHHWSIPVLISDERDLLLDTGGGLKKAEPLFAPNEPILIHNVDILSNLNMVQILKEHSDSMSIATLCVCQRKTSRYFLFDNQQQLKGWTNTKTNETKWVDNALESINYLAFSGIAIIEPHLLELLPEADSPYSIIPCYLEIAKHHRINAFLHQKEDWMDVGKPETIIEAQKWKLF